MCIDTFFKNDNGQTVVKDALVNYYLDLKVQADRINFMNLNSQIK